MKQYTIDWNEDSYGRASFSARDEEHALEILARIRSGELLEENVFIWKNEYEANEFFTNLRELKPVEEN